MFSSIYEYWYPWMHPVSEHERIKLLDCYGYLFFIPPFATFLNPMRYPKIYLKMTPIHSRARMCFEKEANRLWPDFKLGEYYQITKDFKSYIIPLLINYNNKPDFEKFLYTLHVLVYKFITELYENEIAESEKTITQIVVSLIYSILYTSQEIIRVIIKEECYVCFDMTNVRSVCGHVICINCIKKLNKCGYCRSSLGDLVNLFSKNQVKHSFDKSFDWLTF